MSKEKQMFRLPEHYWEAHSRDNDFIKRVVSRYGERAHEFLDDVLHWGKHINANEPELLNYISKPEGIVLLDEWMKRMDYTPMREEWQQKSSTEKEDFLRFFYDRAQKIVTLSKKIDDVSQDINSLYFSQKYKEALQIIRPLIDDYEKLNYFEETDTTRYFEFENFVEEILWNNLEDPSKKTRISFLPAGYLYHWYGILLKAIDQRKEARSALETAYRWNPASAKIIFNLTETLSMNELDEFLRLLRCAHEYCYSRMDLAKCYRGFANAFIGKKEFKDALCCYKIGRYYDKSKDYMRVELAEIAQYLGGDIPDVDIEDVIESSEHYNYPIGVNRKILTIAGYCEEDYRKHGNKKIAELFASIMVDFFGKGTKGPVVN